MQPTVCNAVKERPFKGRARAHDEMSRASALKVVVLKVYVPTKPERARLPVVP
jgi:hypothetical protein